MDSVQRTKRIEHIEKVKFKEQFQERFENIIKEFYIDRNKRSVIFIDDLDRCLPGKTIEVIESLKLFLDVKGCIFILGIDKKVVERSMRVKYKDFLLNDDDVIPISGKEYLEKIIQLIFPLPPITPSDIEDFIENGLKVDEFYKPYLKMISRGMETNPRKIKRFLNHIELQLNLADTIPDIHRELKFIHKNPKEAQINKKRFMATLIEWAIIRNNHSKFMDDVLKDPNILLKIHQYYKPVFSIDDFEDAKILADKIRDQEDPKFKYLMDQFEEKTLEIINDYEGSPYEAKQLTSVITDEINKLLNNRNLVHEEPFSTSALKNEIEIQINQNPVINNLKFHNKKLIQDVYSEILKMEYLNDLAPYSDNQLLLELIKWFPIEDGPELQDINRVIYLSRVTEGDDIRDKDRDKMDSRREEIIHAIKKGKSLRGTEIQGADLSGLNFREKDLSHVNFSRANLINVKMVRTNLRHTELTESNLGKADLRHAELWNANLIRANLEEANLKDSVLFNANLKDADLSRANLTNCGLINANLEGAKLTGAILNNINLNSAQFDSKTNFMGAEINETTINNLRNTNWKDAKWDHYVFNKIEEKYG